MNNDESYIQHSEGGTVFAGPDATRLVQAATLASALRLYANTGIIPTRGVNITRMLTLASQYTGKTYKRGSARTAAADVRLWVEAMKTALPVRDGR